MERVPNWHIGVHILMRRATALILAVFLSTAMACSRPNPAALPSFSAERLAVLRAPLAASGHYYYELRLNDKTIVLCHSGVDIMSYKATSLAVGLPRAAWVTRGDYDKWIGEVWGAAKLDPPLVIQRVRIIPGNQSTLPTPEAAGVVPPTMEELTPVPASYKIFFPNSRCIQVDLNGEITGKQKPVSRTQIWWNDFLQGLGVRKADGLRLRLEMDAKSGAALYRTFQESPLFLVIP